MAKFVNVRLTDEQHDELNAVAIKAGKTVYNYIMSIAKLEEKPLGEEYAPPKPEPKKDKAEKKDGREIHTEQKATKRASGRLE